VNKPEVTDAEVVPGLGESDRGAPPPNHYWGNVISSFETGAQLDLRARLAVEFVKAGMLVQHGEGPMLSPQEIAVRAVETARELIEAFVARGLIKDLPEDDELNRAMRTQIRRNARAQVYSQVSAQAIANEEMPHVAPAPSDTIPRRRS